MKKDVENMMQPDRVAEAVTYLAEKRSRESIPSRITMPFLKM